ncbi:MAG TPA: hypothetical protein VIG32_04225 [Candidatus Baltobacteraceae bacterium]
MLISPPIAQAFTDISARERDLSRAFTPGAVPEKSDVAKGSSSTYALDPLAVAAPPDAYFVTVGEAGKLRYDRAGTLQFRDGALLGAGGRPMMGYRDARSTLAPLRADPVDVALGYASDPRVDGDGAVTYARETIDPRTGAREVRRVCLGRIALARFAAGTKLQPFDGTSFGAPPETAPHLGRARDDNFGPLTPHARAGSGIDIDLGLQRLQEAYLAFDALRVADHAKTGVEKTAMDLLK